MRGRRTTVLVSLGLAALAAAAVATGAGSAPLRGVYVGRVAGSQAFVAVAVGQGQARVYLCDSRRLAVWLPLGRLQGAHVDLTGAHARLTGRVGRKEVQGTVTLADGSGHAFQALLAPRNGAAGLYRAVKTVGRVRYVAGWIIDSDRTERGNVLVTTVTGATSGTVVEPAPQFNPKELSVDIGGDLVARKVVIVF